MSEEHRREQRELWDKEAVKFDDAPDHGLRDSTTRDAWTALLMKWLPAHAKVLDAGCGTGSLSMVMATLGHAVTGIDFSSTMIERARAKAEAAGLDITFMVMDATDPQLEQRFDAILCRHVLWALPSPSLVLQRWVKLLKPKGRLILIEGFWHTGAGLHADAVVKMLPSQCTNMRIEHLSDQPALWGKPVDDERYAIIIELP